MEKADDPIRHLLDVLLTLQVETAATQMALLEKGILTDFELDRQRHHLRQHAEKTLGDSASRDMLVEMLRRFEGPEQ